MSPRKGSLPPRDTDCRARPIRFHCSTGRGVRKSANQTWRGWSRRVEALCVLSLYDLIIVSNLLSLLEQKARHSALLSRCLTDNRFLIMIPDCCLPCFNSQCKMVCSGKLYANTVSQLEKLLPDLVNVKKSFQREPQMSTTFINCC